VDGRTRGVCFNPITQYRSVGKILMRSSAACMAIGWVADRLDSRFSAARSFSAGSRDICAN
jgi:hypothetical protein